MFFTRFLSSIVLLVLIVLFIYLGGTPLLIGCLIVSLIGMYELFRIKNLEKKPVAVTAYAACIIYYLTINVTGFAFIPIAALTVLICYLISFPRIQLDDVTYSIFAFIYAGVMNSCVFLTRNLPSGEVYAFLIFISSWGCDVFAYCFGMLFGKHKIVPKLSPKKSVEGCIGGVIGTAVLTFIIAKILKTDDISVIFDFVLAAVIGSIISQAGDWTASAIKRQNDVKDFGKLIPGHGGIMDRFDSVIFTAPAIYFVVRIISGLMKI